MDDFAGRRRGCRNLTGLQRQLADRLAVRVRILRAEAGRTDGEGLSVTDAVTLAAVQLGLHAPAGYLDPGVLPDPH
ncbi:hypothetical protein [Streptomyces zaomyceticus]|uniref:hypothetical protein n=1 Tax=Streptomyces zaomyceticus TaxID=68286 RepID=UPI0036879C5F